MKACPEYIKQATRYIASPEQAADVRRELQAHLEEAAEALEVDGLDPDAAMAEAIARMGAPECIALDLGTVHHRHLPWRHYLAPVFLGCIIYTIWDRWSDARVWEIGARWLTLLGFSLWPDRARWDHPLQVVRIDVRARWRWAQHQQWDRALIVGTVAGLSAGLVWGLLPRWVEPLADYMVLYPLTAALLTAWVQRRLFPCPAPIVAVGAALAFPLAYLPGYFTSWHPAVDWPAMTAYFTILFGVAAVGAGTLAQLLEEKGCDALLARIGRRNP